MGASTNELTWLELFGDKEVIAYRPQFARLLGSSSAALFLSQALYWQRKVGPRRWWFKVRDAERNEEGCIQPPSEPERQSWEWEVGLTRREYESARSELKKLGVLEERRKGCPARVHFRVDITRLHAIYEEFLQKNQRLVRSDQLVGEIQPTSWPDVAEQTGQSGQLVGKIEPSISETTHETTHPPPPAPPQNRSSQSSAELGGGVRVVEFDLKGLVDAAVWGEKRAGRTVGPRFRSWKEDEILRNGGPSQADQDLFAEYRKTYQNAKKPDSQQERLDEAVSALRSLQHAGGPPELIESARRSLASLSPDHPLLTGRGSVQQICDSSHE